MRYLVVILPLACGSVDGTPLPPPNDASIVDAGEVIVPDAGIAAAEVSRRAIEFGGVLVGVRARETFALINPTAVAVRVQMDPIEDPVFAVETSLPLGTPFDLESGERIEISIDFLSDVSGAHRVIVPIQLCAEGCTTELVVEATARYDPILCRDVFLDRVQAGTCADITFDCVNPNTKLIEVQTATITGDPAYVLTFFIPLGLPAYAPLLVTADFCPTAPGTHDASLVLTTEDPEGVQSRLTTDLQATVY